MQPIKFFDLLTETFSHLFSNWKNFLKIATLPIIVISVLKIILVVGILATLLINLPITNLLAPNVSIDIHENLFETITTMQVIIAGIIFLSTVIAILFIQSSMYVSCSRFTLLEETKSPFSLAFGNREAKYFGYMMLFTLLIALPFIILGLVTLSAVTLNMEVTSATEALKHLFSTAGMLTALLIGLPIYIISIMIWILRRTIIFPAISVGDDLKLSDCPKLCKGHAGQILLASIIISIAVSMPGSIIHDSLAITKNNNIIVVFIKSSLSLLIGTTAELLTGALFVTFISLLYKKLVTNAYAQNQESQSLPEMKAK